MHILKTTANLIISMIFNLFIYIVLLRFLFQWLKVDFYNPLAQAIYKFTNPIVQPMTKYIPNYKSIDFSSLILIFVLIGIEAFLKVFISTGTSPKFLGLSLLILSGLFSQVINLLFYAILINVVLKWTNPNSIQTNLLTQTFSKITDPLIQPARRLIPPMGGIDVSPIIVMLGLQLLNIILVGPLSLEAHKFI